MKAFDEQRARVVSQREVRDCTAIRVDIASRLDRLPVTHLHLIVTSICALGFTFDLTEIALGNLLSAVFSTAPHEVGASQLSWLLASVYIGAVVGAPAFGRLADIYGRRTTMIAMLLFLGASSFLAAVSSDVMWLIVARGLSGLVLGAYPPLMIVYLTDLVPARRRGLLIMIAVTVASLGPVGMIFLVRWLTPLIPLAIPAWRWAFLVCGFGAAVVGGLLWQVPESPRWLATRGRFAEANTTIARFERSRAIFPTPSGKQQSSAMADSHERASVGPQNAELPARSRPRGSQIATLAAVFFLSPWGTTGFVLLSGAVLAAKGLRIADTLWYVGISMFGQFLGALLGAMVIDRIPRRALLIVCAAVMATSGLVFAASIDEISLMVTSAIFPLAAALYIPTLNIYAAEIFPTASRAVATAGLWAICRGGSALVPLVLLPLLHIGGAMAIFYVMAVAMLISVILVLFCAPPGRTGQAVD